MAQIVIITYPHPSARPQSSDLVEEQFQALLSPSVIEKEVRKINSHIETIPRPDALNIAPLKQWISVYRIDGDEQLSSLIGRLSRSILDHYNMNNRTQLPAGIPHGFLGSIEFRMG
jgi:uncharacterized protein involved in exopolysaccharide biosynthesis